MPSSVFVINRRERIFKQRFFWYLFGKAKDSERKSGGGFHKVDPQPQSESETLESRRTNGTNPRAGDVSGQTLLVSQAKSFCTA